MTENFDDQHTAATSAGVVDNSNSEPAGRDQDFTLYEDAIRYFGQGNLAAATQSLEDHLTHHPAHASAYSLLGNLHRLAGRFGDAEDAWRRYSKLKPANRQGLLEIGRCRLAAGDDRGAGSMFDQYLADEGETPESLYEVGMAFQQIANNDAASAYHERALALKPDFHLARQQLAIACHARGELKLAEKLFRDVVRVQTGNFEVYRHLGAIHRDHGDLTTALADFRHAMQLERRAQKLDAERDVGFGLVPRDIGLINLRVYSEQITYLLEHNKLSDAYGKELDRYREVLAELGEKAGSNLRVSLNESQRRRLGRSFCRLLHLGPLSAIPAGALNHQLDFTAIGKRHAEEAGHVMVLDDFLSEEAVATLTAYCLESTIWFCPARQGMIRSRLEDGFGTGLMLQLVEELRTRFPNQLGRLRLSGMEGRIYAARAYDLPTDEHTDGVLLTIWLSPNHANLEPDRGGLILQSRRGDPGSDSETPQTVQHRHNRAVLADDTLTIRPDDCQFRPGLVNHRLEICLRFTPRH